MAKSDQSVSVRVPGARELRRDLRRLGDDLGDLKDANAAAAALVASEAARRAPRKSGRLAASVRGNRAASKATVSAGRAAVPYAGPIHYGWPAHHIEAQPFVVDAAQDTQPLWLPLYEHNISKAVDKLAGHTY